MSGLHITVRVRTLRVKTELYWDGEERDGEGCISL